MLVRTDIPLPDQIVQVGHACLEAGHRFEQPPQPCHLIVLAVLSRNHLLDALAQLELQGVHFALFYEPDNNLGYTAACSEPLSANLRRLFRRFPLWSETMIIPLSAALRRKPGISPVCGVMLIWHIKNKKEVRNQESE